MMPWSVRSSTLARSMTSPRRRAPSGEQLHAVLHDEAAGDDVGRPLEHARLLVDGEDWHHEAVLREVSSIAQHLVANFARPRAVDQHTPDRSFADDAGRR